MKLSKKSALIFLCAAALLSFALLALSAGGNRAYAGESDRSMVSENFDKGIDTNYWEQKVAAGDSISVVAEENAINGLTCADAQGGSGLIGIETIDNGALLEIEIEKLIPMSKGGGWLSFIFGTKITGTDFVEYENLGTGKIMFLVPSVSGGAFRWEIRSYNENLEMTDGNGAALGARNEKFYDGSKFIWQRFTLPEGLWSDGIISSTLSVAYKSDGSLEIAYRGIDEDSSKNTVLFKSTQKNLGKYYDGRVGTSFAGTEEGGYDLVFRDVKVFAYKDGGIDRENPAARIYGGTTSPLRDFYVYQSPKGGELFYGQKSMLRLGSADGGSGGDYTQIALTKSIKDDPLVEKGNLSFEMQVGVEELVGDKKFGVVVGMDSYRRTFRQSGASFIYIYNAGGLRLGAVSYAKDQAGEIVENAIVSGVALGVEEGQTFELGIIIGLDKKIQAFVNGEKLDTGTAAVGRIDGYCSLALGGAVTDADNYACVTVDDVEIYNRIYEKSTYADISADFTDGKININEWSLPDFAGNVLQKSTGVYAQDGVLVFDEVNYNSNITSKPQYSNFEFSFDVVDVLRAPITDASGNLLKPASAWIGVMFQIPNLTYANSFMYLVNDYKVPYFVFSVHDSYVDGAIPENSRGKLALYNMGKDTINIDLPAEYNLFDKSLDGVTVTVKTQMTDGKLVISMKRNDRTEWYVPTDSVSGGIDIGSATPGHVAIRGYGEGNKNMSSSFKVDNLSIKNTDKDKGDDLYKFPEKYNIPASTPDYDYDSVLDGGNLPSNIDGNNTGEGGSGCNGSIAPTPAAIAALLTAAAAVMIARRKRT